MDNKLLISLTEKYKAPLYVYDAEKIVSQYKRFENAFNQVKSLKINYATKALSNISILKLLKSLGSNIDCVSIQEIHLGLKAGFNPKQISFTPSGVSLEEIESAVALGVKINIDNLEILKQFGTKHPKVPVCIRINPHIMAGGNKKISVGHTKSKFGISKYFIAQVKEIEKETGMLINGVHMHTGSGILDVNVFLQGAEILFKIAKEFENLDFIDFGGGFKVAYKENDPATNIEEFGKIMSKRFNEFSKDYGKELSIVFEPGKFLVSESGNFLAKVNVVKKSNETVFAGIDSGFNHLIRPMYYGSYHHIVNISNALAKENKYTVVGYICENDTFAEDRMISTIRQGDILCFKNAGAYAFTMASNYNSRFRPAEVMLYQGKDYLIRERETMEDILNKQIEVNIDL
ncbi:MAG: diaminopimelate decarboxylase [Flavobacteriaceae bacterium]|nr:diaminopimelate decarboxylase [Flavobacteriaceae bacterium]